MWVSLDYSFNFSVCLAFFNKIKCEQTKYSFKNVSVRKG